MAEIERKEKELAEKEAIVDELEAKYVNLQLKTDLEKKQMMTSSVEHEKRLLIKKLQDTQDQAAATGF